MYKMLTVVFNDEKTAYEGAHALLELNDAASIAVHAAAVVCKSPDGTVSSKRVDEDLPLHTFAGTTIGALIGLLGGAAGALAGGGLGALAGNLADLHNADVDMQFVSDVSSSLTPGKCAVIAEIDEDRVTPVDTRMEALGGLVHRTLKSSVEHDQWSRVLADARAELNQLRAEEGRARADRKEKLRTQIDRLSKGLDAKVQRAKANNERIRLEIRSKMATLQQRSDREQGDVKAALDARIAQLQQNYENRVQAQVEAYGGDV